MRVALLPLGELPQGALAPLAARLGGLGIACVTRAAAELPPEAYVPDRGRWDADRILEELPPSVGETLVAVTGEDLFAGGLKFVFGLADAERRVALVSVARLRSRSPAATGARLVKEVVHELGHTLGMAHCPDPTCVMHFSNSLADTDGKGSTLCESCEARVPEEARKAFAGPRRG